MQMQNLLRMIKKVVMFLIPIKHREQEQYEINTVEDLVKFFR